MTEKTHNVELENDLRELLDRGTEAETIPTDAKSEVWNSMQEAIESGDLPDPAEIGSGEQIPSAETTTETVREAASSGSAKGLGAKLTSSTLIKGVVTAAIGVTIGTWVYLSTRESTKVQKVSRDVSANQNRAAQKLVGSDEPESKSHHSGSEPYDPPPNEEGSDQKAPKSDKSQTEMNNGAKNEPGVQKKSPKSSPSARGQTPENDRAKKMDRRDGSGTKAQPKSPSGSKVDDFNLSAEKQILSKARKAIQNKDPEKALEYLSEHQRRFPDGQLQQERAVYRIRALKKSGRVKRAKQKATQFLENHPDSLFTERVSNTLRALQ